MKQKSTKLGMPARGSMTQGVARSTNIVLEREASSGEKAERVHDTL